MRSPWRTCVCSSNPLKRASTLGARQDTYIDVSDVTHPRIFVAAKILLGRVLRTRQRSRRTAVRQRTEEWARRVEHNRVLSGHHSDRQVGKGSKQSNLKHCQCVRELKSSVNFVHHGQVVFLYRREGTLGRLCAVVWDVRGANMGLGNSNRLRRVAPPKLLLWHACTVQPCANFDWTSLRPQ